VLSLGVCSSVRQFSRHFENAVVVDAEALADCCCSTGVWVLLFKRCLLLLLLLLLLLPMSCLRGILARSCVRVLLPRISRFLILRKLLDDGDRTHRTCVSPPLSVASAFPVYGGVFWLLVMAGMVSGQNSSLTMEHLLVLLFAQ
jgi:hypothetical protein